MTSKNTEFQLASIEAWSKAAAKSAPGGNLDTLNWQTPDGITVKPLYTAADTRHLSYANTLPGFEPYLRGPQATMYAVRPWTIRQYAGFSTAEESNAFYRKALAAGGQGAPFVPLPPSSPLRVETNTLPAGAEREFGGALHLQGRGTVLFSS